MIDLYTWQTPNGRKVSIMLEEIDLDYTVFPINISKDEQFQPHFLEMSPNNRIPAIVDKDNNNFSLFESGAILMYLAEKTGKLINKSNRDEYYRTIEWLMWQMGGVGPMFGQVHHFVKYNKGKSEYAEERYSKEARRLYGVMDKRLNKNQYISGKEYSIADISIWPWTARFDWQEIDLNDFPNVARWYKEMIDRPAVQKGWLVPQNDQVIPSI
ncbi:glutathione S-transferase N-terminal domain-containing protein [Pseudomonadota bacterium]|nr:glutathione S-transferase N-terminal domain-containing protein [Pseudomonadota bacterium]